MEQTHITLNRTFGRRIGKTLSNTQKHLIDNYLEKYRFTEKKFTANNKYQKVILEIGFGMGEHFINQILLNPNYLFLGAEVYLNGAANVIKRALGRNLENYLIWPDDIDLMIDYLPPKSLDGVYILFPDPWHKRRYMKKRLVTSQRVKIIKDKLKHSAFFSFASDIEDYFHDVKNLLEQDSDFVIIGKDFSTPHPGYVITKYHQKAVENGRTPTFIKAVIR